MKPLAIASLAAIAMAFALPVGTADAAPRGAAAAGQAEKNVTVAYRGSRRGHEARHRGRGSLRTPLINRRIANQQRRIRRGVRTGDLTFRESRRLRSRLGSIRQTLRRARRDGRVTQWERRRVIGMLNRNSRAIARLRHNGRGRI